MKMLVIPLPGNEGLARSLVQGLDAETGALQVRRFPDGETYLRYVTPVEGARVILACTLDRPDEKLLPLIFAAATARELGAAQVVLVAPYLAYLRQDRRFQPGEAVTSACFAQVLDRRIDWLVSVDPHLHRYRSLSDIYSVPAEAVQAAPAISCWIRETVPDPLIVGPDRESVQWVQAVAGGAGAPFVVLEKIRRGDRDVEVSVPDVGRWRDRTPVLLDDIISTAQTMIETIAHIRAAGLAPPVCVGVHAVFAGRAYEDLKAAGAQRIATCNTIEHASNAIDISAPLVRALRSLSPRKPSVGKPR